MFKTRLETHAISKLRASISLYSWLKMNKIYQKLIVLTNELRSSVTSLSELR
mgnify:FL=1